MLTATQAFAVGSFSLTRDIDRVEAGLPVGDATGLFERWRDHTNAERMKVLLSVLTQHTVVVAVLLAT